MERTIGLLLIIGLGFALKSKIKNQDQLKGLKVLILSIALPATIFAALLEVKTVPSMLLLPVLGLVVNIVFFLAFHLVLEKSGKISDDNKRTLLMLMPSMAPGLSCFPFIVEYLGSDALAKAALADVGNKIFVLIILHMIAMNWYYRTKNEVTTQRKDKVKSLLVSLIKEPINIVIILALTMLSFDINLDTLPEFISSSILRLASIMAPLILLFIGMAVKVRNNEFGLIFRMLTLRSGIAFLLSSFFMMIIPNLNTVMILLMLVFIQSSASFWPYAHINLISDLEKEQNQKTFNNDLALSILAYSLPFSTLVILGILSFPDISLSPIYPATIGLIFLLIFIAQPLSGFFKNVIRHDKKKVPQSTTSYSG